ncbi:MAG: GMC family oxidoreductase N-terminal domain-containing protein [Burkholderiaceae bacterium]|nr:GMC family oxidoreductase N-terminal domain-containing protein [Burkholderiaceae bacterium]
MESFDYIIVGGGTAASVVACRLSERGHSVCVLEAGPEDSNPYIRIPAGFTKTLGDERVTWQMSYEASAGTNGRRIPLVQGKTLGGSSAVNGVVYNRGQAGDFDGWAALGNPGWSYADVLPYFRKSERFLSGGEDAFRGREGNIPVTTTAWSNEACETFMRAAHSVGIPANDDYNGRAQVGIGMCQGAIYKGERWSAARGYLHPARKKHGVRVLTNATVTRVLTERRRAIGVAYRKGAEGAEIQVLARKEVIVSAGSINSPKLLQLSGIGPAALLREHGIAVVHELPGVGENLRDHITPRLVVRARPGVDSLNHRARGFGLAQEVVRWFLGGKSILGLTAILVYGFWKSRADLPNPDFAITFTPGSYKLGMLGRLDDAPGLTCGAWQLRPQSSGYVRIASADVRRNPIMQPNFLADEADQRVLVEALKCVRSIMGGEVMRSIVETELLPGADVSSDDELLDFARQYGMTGYHPIGTCKMGPSSDPMAVVDERLRVHGIDGLRVIDASVMPTIPSANTCASALMIGEKGADLILNLSTS